MFCKVIVLVNLLTLLLEVTFANYTCQTILYDLDDGDGKLDSPGIHLFYTDHTNWRDAKVKYEIDETMTPSEKAELTASMDEYHSKTCVRFELKSDTKTEAYLSIEKSSSVQCVESSYCKSENDYHYARFNTNCMTKDSFIHQLGHSICLGHENQRWDRDEFVPYESCYIKPGKTISKDRFIGIYDYSSQMHLSCGDNCKREEGLPHNSVPPFCGKGVQSGLSVIDADTINQRYDCQACHRHRWIPINLLNDSDKEDMYSFGNVDHLGLEIFPCRAFHLGEVAIGMYTHEEQTCWLTSKRTNSSEMVKKHVEILTIPGGLSTDCSNSGTGNKHIFQYELESNLVEGEEGNILRNGVPGGSLILGYREYLVGYIAFGTISSQSFDNGVEGNEIFGVDVIGTAWNEYGGLTNASFATGKGRTVETNNFKVFICK